MPTNCATVLAAARASSTPIIHLRARYDASLPVWGRWVQTVQQTRPFKPHEWALEAEKWAAEQEGEPIIYKPTWDGFLGTQLEETLQQCSAGANGGNIAQLFIMGLNTSCCVQHTAHAAFARGFMVILVEDCCADKSTERHQAAISLFEGLVYSCTTASQLCGQLEAGK